MAKGINLKSRNLMIRFSFAFVFLACCLSSNCKNKNNSINSNESVLQKKVSNVSKAISNRQKKDRLKAVGLFDYDNLMDTLYYALNTSGMEPFYRCEILFGSGKINMINIPTVSGYIKLSNCKKGCIEKSEITTGVYGSEEIGKYIYDRKIENWFLHETISIKETDYVEQKEIENQWSIDDAILLIKNKRSLLSLYEFIEQCYNDELHYQVEAAIRGIDLDEFTVKLSNKNVTNFNNIGYYLEQMELYEPSIYILKNIVEQFPDRTVAYLNLGDAYLGSGEEIKAKEAYNKYAHQMRMQNKSNKIPLRLSNMLE